MVALEVGRELDLDEADEEPEAESEPADDELGAA
jgi:hypothetical protein